MPSATDWEAEHARQDKAIQEARSALLAKGLTYPLYNINLSIEDNYGALLAYSEQEAALVVQFMRASSPPPREKPIDDGNKLKRQWGRSYYDD